MVKNVMTINGDVNINLVSVDSNSNDDNKMNSIVNKIVNACFCIEISIDNPLININEMMVIYRYLKF